MGVVQVLVSRDLCQKRGQSALGEIVNGMVVPAEYFVLGVVDAYLYAQTGKGCLGEIFKGPLHNGICSEIGIDPD